MPVSRAICCVAVIWVACLLEGMGIERFDSGFDFEISCGVDGEGWWSGKWDDLGKAGKRPPSRERETWILVSFVSREIVARRRVKGSEEPILAAHKLTILIFSLSQLERNRRKLPYASESKSAEGMNSID
jgi:hypothetical protein